MSQFSQTYMQQRQYLGTVQLSRHQRCPSGTRSFSALDCWCQIHTLEIHPTFSIGCYTRSTQPIVSKTFISLHLQNIFKVFFMRYDGQHLRLVSITFSRSFIIKSTFFFCWIRKEKRQSCSILVKRIF